MGAQNNYRHVVLDIQIYTGHDKTLKCYREIFCRKIFWSFFYTAGIVEDVLLVNTIDGADTPALQTVFRLKSDALSLTMWIKITNYIPEQSSFFSMYLYVCLYIFLKLLNLIFYNLDSFVIVFKTFHYLPGSLKVVNSFLELNFWIVL